MKYPEIIELIKCLAQSQGSYGRMLRSIEELDEENTNELIEVLEAQNFQDPIDFIMWVEC